MQFILVLFVLVGFFGLNNNFLAMLLIIGCLPIVDFYLQILICDTLEAIGLWLLVQDIIPCR